ncbi:MAG: ETC complex I subunit [Rickettsiaceae bacterium]
MQVRIFKPSKSPMQSAAGIDKWLLEFVTQPGNKFKEELMGRTSSSDMSSEVKLYFPTLESAIAFANKNSYAYEVINPQTPTIHKKSYAANFK